MSDNSNADGARSVSGGSSELRIHAGTIAGCTLGIAIGGSSLYFYSSGLFIKPLAVEFGWSRSTVSTASMITVLMLGFCGPLAAILADRIGNRRVMFGSLIGLAAAFALLAGGVNGIVSLLAISLFLGIIASGSTPVLLTRPIIERFAAQRGVALGIAITGTGFGAVLMPLLLSNIIASHGWRAGYATLALVVIAGLPILAWLFPREIPGARHLRARPAAGPTLPPPLPVIFLVFVLAATAALGSVVHLVPLLTDRGLSPERAGAYAGILGLTVIGGRLLTGGALDRFEASRLTCAIFTLAAAGPALLAWGPQAAEVPALLLLGLAVGSEHDLAAYMVGRYFPSRYGIMFGIVYGGTAVGAAVGPLVAGSLFDMTGAYTAWLGLATALLLLSAYLALTIRGKGLHGIGDTGRA